MAKTNEYRDYVVTQLSSLGNIKCRPMMGEYLLYYDNVLFGGLYDNRLLIKKVDQNAKYHLKEEIPYGNAKTMYWLTDLDNQELFKDIILTTVANLPVKKTK